MYRVLILGDSPLINTGFGRVNKKAAAAFQSAGWDVASVAALTTKPMGPLEDDIRMYYPQGGDVLGLGRIHDAMVEFQPDMVYMTADAGTALAIASNTPPIASLLYIPIEGEPLGNNDWRGLISDLPVVTCSKYGTEIIRRDTGKEVPYVYHGIDHETFRVNGKREQTRSRLGWNDKFIVTAVSTNVRRKQLPRLVEAISILRYRYHVNDIILYLHTVPFQGYWLDGHNLKEVTDYFGVSDITLFNDQMRQRNDAIPEEEFTVDGQWRPGLVDLYNASDLFVNPSQVEGFGLPIAEAMACGLPVLVTKYAAGWEVASPAGRGLPVKDFEIHKSTTKYANVDIEAMAKEILRLKNGPNERARMSAAGLQRVKDFSWDAFGTEIIRLSEESINAHQERRQKQQEADKAQEPVAKGEHIREDEGRDSPEEGHPEPQGRDKDTANETPQDKDRTQEEGLP